MTKGDKQKKCSWCGKPLGNICFTDSKTKKSFHFSMNGNDCLKSWMESKK